MWGPSSRMGPTRMCRQFVGRTARTKDPAGVAWAWWVLRGMSELLVLGDGSLQVEGVRYPKRDRPGGNWYRVAVVSGRVATARGVGDATHATPRRIPLIRPSGSGRATLMSDNTPSGLLMVGGSSLSPLGRFVFRSLVVLV